MEDAIFMAQVAAVTESSADPLAASPGEWQGGVSAATEAALQEAIKHAQELALGNMSYSIDSRPVSEQRSEYVQHTTKLLPCIQAAQ